MNSKELLEQTGISRATLNNYIALGIVPRPEVLPPEPQDGAAPRIGYFPEGTAQRIAEIQRLKQEGWSMSRIAAHFGAAPPAGQTQPLAGARPTPLHESAALAAPRRDMPRLSIDEIAHPAYLVGTDFSVLWFNAASAGVLGAAAGGENVLKRLLLAPAAPARDEILRFHLAVARQHGAALDGLGDDLPAAQRAELERLGRDAQPPSPGFVSHVCGPGGTAEGVCLYAIRFREGILFAHVPRGPAADELESLLQARETVAGDLRRRRLPVLNDVAVVVMDLQHAPRIWSALPAEEYFELINQIWLAADPIVRRHRGTHGKHPRDGLACYFLRQRDGSYAWNALLAAHEMREAMRGLSKEWQLRKGWTTELCMDTGVDEGQQWVGTLQSGAAAGAEFTMYGETLARATAMSGLARGGAIWATKNVLAKLAPHERQRLKWGIHRRDRQGHDVFVPAVFSTIERVAAPDAMAEQWRDLAGLPITEIVDIAGAEGRRERAVDQQPI